MSFRDQQSLVAQDGKSNFRSESAAVAIRTTHGRWRIDLSPMTQTHMTLNSLVHRQPACHDDLLAEMLPAADLAPLSLPPKRWPPVSLATVELSKLTTLDSTANR